MFSSWVPSAIKDIRNSHINNPDGFPDEIIFVVKKICESETLNLLWSKYRKLFDSDQDCAEWLFYSTYRSYFYEGLQSNQLTLTEKKAATKKLIKAAKDFNASMNTLGLNKSLWGFFPHETLKEFARLLAIKHGADESVIDDTTPYMINLNVEIGQIPSLSDVILDITEIALIDTNSATSNPSPNSKNAKLNFFIREFYEQAKTITKSPSYERIADLANVFFPEQEIDFIYVRDRVKKK